MANKDPLNQIQYLKKQYETAGDNKGLQKWASNQAKSYYSQLDPNVAKQVQGMNASQLSQYRNSVSSAKSNKSKQNDTNQTNVNQQPTAPKVTAPPTLSIDDLAKQFGFDYSRESAQKQSEAEAQAKRDAIANQKRGVQSGVESATDSLDRNYFLKGLQQSQNQTNTGLNGGIASDQNLRMAMSRQAELGDVYRDANLENMRLEDNLGRVDLEALAKADALYNDRRQQGFNNTMSYNDLLRRNFESDRNYDRGVFENDRSFDYGVGRDKISDQRYDNEWNRTLERDKIGDNRYQNEWDYGVKRDNIADSQWAQTHARLSSGGGSGGYGGLTEAQMRRLAEEEFKKQLEFVDNNQKDLQMGSGAYDHSQMEFILDQQKKRTPPKPNTNFTGGYLDNYKYLFR